MSELKAPAVDFGKNPFEFKKTDTYGLLVLSGDMDPEMAKEFEKRIRPQFEGFTTDLAIDLSQCSDIHPAWSRLFMQLATLVKQAQKKTRVISPNGNHKSFFQDQGLSSSFPICDSLEAAMGEFTAKKSFKLDVNFINPFLEGTIEVLKIQASTAAKAGAPTTKDPKSSFGGDISGVIGLVSDSFTGSVVISFPAETFLKIMSKMLGEDFKELTPDLQDGAAELTNIIFGFAKRILNEKGYGIKMAIPSVITGKDHSIQNNSKGPRIVIPFESDAGNFGIEICVGD
ncbi:MAG: chemotaxis protein CheX [Cryobacterium sp.]|nr:chemotaxis protein CheX [Oligoflexia bacterium]